MNRTKFILSLVLLTAIFIGGCGNQLTSPDGKVKADIFTTESGQLAYNLKKGSKTILNDSSMGIIYDGDELCENASFTIGPVTTVNETYETRGVHTKAVNNYNTAMVTAVHEKSGTIYNIETRIYNDGFAYRYIVPGKGKHTVHGEKTSWNLPADSKAWSHASISNYEAVHKRRDVSKIKEDTDMAFPVTVELPGGGYAVMTEAALFNYSGMSLKATGTDTLVSHFADDTDGWQLVGEVKSPWRVTMVSDDLNGLVNSDLIANLCDAPDKKLFPDGINTDWIKTGRSLWHWWSEDNPDYERHKEWVDATAKMGLESYLVDESWGHWKDGSKDKWDHLKEFVEYAKERNVDVWVWKAYPDRNDVPGIYNKKDRIEFFARCAKLGVKGLKIDFMETESKELIDFYEDALKEAAGFKLMMNFHGANKPTGESRTYPNEMTREAVLGLEYNKWSRVPAHHYASLPFTRGIAGHMDFTPTTFNEKMLAGTTFSMQLASAIVFTSPTLHWADKPEVYFQSPALEIIKEIPSTWDETIVLKGSEIGKLAAFARRKGDDWFVGIINGEKRAKEYSLDLSFLDDGKYNATTVEDTGKAADMKVTGSYLNKNSKVTVKMDAGGGYVAMLKKKLK